jgi:hypothetical protein
VDGVASTPRARCARVQQTSGSLRRTMTDTHTPPRPCSQSPAPAPPWPPPAQRHWAVVYAASTHTERQRAGAARSERSRGGRAATRAGAAAAVTVSRRGQGRTQEGPWLAADGAGPHPLRPRGTLYAPDRPRSGLHLPQIAACPSHLLRHLGLWICGRWLLLRRQFKNSRHLLLLLGGGGGCLGRWGWDCWCCVLAARDGLLWCLLRGLCGLYSVSFAPQQAPHRRSRLVRGQLGGSNETCARTCSARSTVRCDRSACDACVRQAQA